MKYYEYFSIKEKMPSKRQIIRKKAFKKLSTRQALREEVDLECPICYKTYGTECTREVPVGCIHYCCSDCCVKLSKMEKVFCPICRLDWTLWIHSKFNNNAKIRFNFAKCLSEITMIPDDEELFTIKSKKSKEYYFIFLQEGDDEKYALISAEPFYTGIRNIINFMPYYKIMLNYTFNKDLFCFCDANRAFNFYMKVSELSDDTFCSC
jgi:hypothetical protein